MSNRRRSAKSTTQFPSKSGGPHTLSMIVIRNLRATSMERCRSLDFPGVHLLLDRFLNAIEDLFSQLIVLHRNSALIVL